MCSKILVNCLLGPSFIEGHSTATSFRNIPENELLLCCKMCLMQQKDKCGYNMMECLTHYFDILIKETRNKAAARGVHNPIHCCHNKRNRSHSATPLNGETTGSMHAPIRWSYQKFYLVLNVLHTQQDLTENELC
jgi:hypothetical protein